jgi:predicted secreted protein
VNQFAPLELNLRTIFFAPRSVDDFIPAAFDLSDIARQLEAPAFSINGSVSFTFHAADQAALAQVSPATRMTNH